MAKRIWDRLTPTEKEALSQGANLLGKLREKVPPEWREQAAEGRKILIAGPRLRELREARQISQEEMAARLGRTQSAISQIEKRSDLLLSTLTQYIEAAEGELVNFTVQFPEGEIRVVPFQAKPEDSES